MPPIPSVSFLAEMMAHTMLLEHGDGAMQHLARGLLDADGKSGGDAEVWEDAICFLTWKLALRARFKAPPMLLS